MPVFIPNNNSEVSAPFTGAVAVTKSDTTVLTATRGIYVGGAGNLAVTMMDDTVVTFTGVPAGTFLPIRATKVMSTNTTATAIVALY